MSLSDNLNGLKDIKDFQTFIVFLEHKKKMQKIVSDIADKKIQKDITDALQSMNVNKPRIIVIGEESSGKSTLLNVIVAKHIFPRASGFCTKCPIHLETVENNDTEVLKIRFSHGNNFFNPDYDAVVTNEEIKKNIFDKIGAKISLVPISLLIEKRSKDFIPLSLIDLPGLFYKKEESAQLLEQYLQPDDIYTKTTFLICVPWSQNSDNNPILAFLHTHLKSNKGYADEFKKKSAVVFTKVDKEPEILSIPKIDFINPRNIYFTAYGPDESDGIEELTEYESTYWNGLPKKKLENFENRHGTENVLGFIGSEYKRHVDSLSKGLFKLLTNYKSKFIQILTHNWYFWDMEKEKGFKKFRNDILDKIQEYHTHLDYLSSFVVLDFHVMMEKFVGLLEQVCIKQFDSKWQRFDFFWVTIKSIIQKTINDKRATMKDDYDSIIESQQVIQKFLAKTSPIPGTERKLFFQKSFLLCLESVYQEIKVVQVDIQENPEYLSLFESFKSFRDYDLGHTEKDAIFTESQFHDYQK